MVIDRLDLAIYAAFGAFTGIYARNESPRSRMLRQSLAGKTFYGDELMQEGINVEKIDADFTAYLWVLEKEE